MPHNLLLLPLRPVAMITAHRSIISEVLLDRQVRVTTTQRRDRRRAIPTKDSITNSITSNNDVQISHRTHRRTEVPSRGRAGGTHHRAADLRAHTWAAEVRR